MTKHDAVWEWIQGCPLIGDLFFNASRAEDGNTQLTPSETIVEEYIDGSSKRNYNCSLTRFIDFSTDPNDEYNVLALNNFEEIGEWAEEQMEIGNIPEFPDGCTVTDIRVLPNESGWMTAQDMMIAKFMIQFQIEYIRP